MPRHLTICDLPTELLDMILLKVRHRPNKHAWRDSWYDCMTQVSLACHCLRGVALEHLFNRRRLQLSGSNITSFDHPIQFLHAHPRLAKKITSISIDGDSTDLRLTIDNSIVATLMALLPNVNDVEFDSLHYGPPTRIATLNEHAGPYLLKTLRLTEESPGSHSQVSSLTGLFSILSLFSTEVLYQSTLSIPTLDTDPSIPSDLRRPFTVQRLDIYSAVLHPDPTYISWLKALAENIAPDGLTALSVQYRTPQVVFDIGILLARAGMNVRSLELQCDVPVYFSHDDLRKRKWVHPLQDTWQQLKLSSCTHLETILLTVSPSVDDQVHVESLGTNRPDDCKRVTLTVSDAAVGVLLQAAWTLKRITIFLHGFSIMEPELGKQLQEVRAFDKAVTQEAFPALEEFELSVAMYEDDEEFWVYLRAEARRVLTQLHARGKLTISEPWRS